MKNKIKLLRITTIPLSLFILLEGQMGYMKKNNYDLIMISASGKHISSLVKREGCPHIIVPFSRQISLRQDLKCLWQLIRIIRKEKPDIVHTHTPKAGLLGMLAARLCGVKLKLHTIAGLPLMTAKGGKRKILEITEKLTYWSADYVLANSKSIMSFVKEHKFTNDVKLDMIGEGSSNGIDLKRFSKETIQEKILEKIKKRIAYDNKFKYILSVGRIVKDKGIIELIEAYLELSKYFDNLRLIIIGSLEEVRSEEILPSNIKIELKRNPNIIHVDWSDEVEYYMDLADILVHASYREGFPNVPLQAGAMECPIICSEIPGNIDIVTNRKTGLYFETGNVNDLVKKIRYALSNDNLMQLYAKKLRKEVEYSFSREFIHEELLKFYQEKLYGYR